MIKWRLAGQPASRSRTAVSILIDRAVGLISLTIGSLLALIFLSFSPSSPVPLVITQLIATLSILISAALVIWFLLIKYSPKFLARFPLPAGFKDFTLIKVTLRQFILTTLISLFNQLITVTSLFLIAQVLGIELNWFELLIVIQLSWIVAAIPISLGGLGTA